MEQDFKYQAGDRLDGFIIAEPIFSGALSEVYRAIDTLTQQTVAMKIPSMDIINHRLVYYHYQNETHVLAGIRHRNIIRLLGRNQTTAYNVFEYIPGMDLRKRMHSQKWMPFEKAKHYIEQIAQGLTHLHSCGIIHLDIKPENILITPADQIKIVDFGLARRLGATDVLQEDFTRPHGTPYYAAPEQLERYRDDPRTDLYSLGLVLYEMLTGRLPFEKSSDLNRVRKRLKIDPVPPRRYRAEIPQTVEEVILKSLSREIEGRYPSVADFVEALERSHAVHSGSGPPQGIEGDARPLKCELQADRSPSAAHSHGLLAALDDDAYAEAVAATALEEALARGSQVTLLSVVDGDHTDDWTRYGDAVKGDRWGRRLDQFVQEFRHYGIEPMVRIRSGSPARTIVETAEAIEADIIIVGPPRRQLFKRLFGGRTIDRILRQTARPVKIAAEPMQPSFPVDADPVTLELQDLKALDYYLVSLWVQQMNWLATFVQGVMSEPLVVEKDFTPQSPVSEWLEKIEPHPQWQGHLGWARGTNERFQSVARQMIDAVRQDRPEELRTLYLKQAIPLLCDLRSGFQKLSTSLREQSAISHYQRMHVLERSDCPLTGDTHLAVGPMRHIQAIREFFCAHPDAAPEECLEWIASERP